MRTPREKGDIRGCTTLPTQRKNDAVHTVRIFGMQMGIDSRAQLSRTEGLPAVEAGHRPLISHSKTTKRERARHTLSSRCQSMASPVALQSRVRRAGRTAAWGFAALAALPTEAPPLPSDAGLALIAVLRGLLQLPASKGNGGARGEQSVRFSA